MRNERLHEEMHPVFPSNNIICKDCLYRKPGIIGFKNSYCKEYPEGKPREVLFEDADCRYYRPDMKVERKPE